MARWDTEMEGQENVKSNWGKLLEDLGGEMKLCSGCKSGGTQTITKGREDEGKKSYSKSAKWHMESHGELWVGGSLG